MDLISPRREMKLGILASGGGSNAEAILRNIEAGNLNAQAKIIITNNSNAGVYEKADKYNIPIECINKNRFNKDLFLTPEAQILQVLKDHDVNLVILAGYMKLISKEMVAAFLNRILNIHPSLLPKYGGEGMHGHFVHEEVINSNDTKSGATIHLVNEKYDDGPILSQYEVPRYPNDTADSLAARILRIEHVAFSQTLRDVLAGHIDLDNPPKQLFTK